MAKQIEGQLSFDFMETFDTKEISMEDYINRPETIDKTKDTPVKQVMKKNMDSKKHTSEESSANEIKSVEKTKPSDEKPLKERGTKMQSIAAKFIPNNEGFYKQAAEYVTEHRGITIGTIMRLYQISAINACEIFQKLIGNNIIDKSGRLSKEKKEL
ncbi:MAG: hypothetical protein ACLUJV_02455 [Blautia producta]